MTHDTAAAPAESLDLARCMFEGTETNPEKGRLRYRYPSAKDGEPVLLLDELKIEFVEDKGNAFFEGDILLGPAETVRNAEKTEDKGLVITGDEFRWPDKPVEFLFADSSVKSKVDFAIKHWEDHTPFRFTEISAAEVTPSTDFISFDDQGGCFSNVGRQGGLQTISVGSGCTVGAAIHEIGHALGLWHEQGRADRDNFVTVFMDRVKPNAKHNFKQHILDGDDVGTYDFSSIMHYPEWAFQIDNRPTIVAKGGQSIGQRNGLSAGDIAAIKAIYPDLDWAEVPFKFGADGHCSCGHM